MFPRSRLARLVPPDRLDHLEASHAQLPDGQQRAQERAWAAVDNDTLRHQLNLEPAEDDYETVVDHVDAAGAHAKRVEAVRGLLEPAKPNRARNR